MKKATTILTAILLVAVAATAQNPKLSYSAVVRNSANELVANENITVAVSIANSETGAAVYAETHTVTTNQNGLVSLTIGEGTVESGSLAAVDWRNAYITTQYTLPDGNSLTSTMPVNAVPYALYADNISPEALLGAVGAMTAEQKAALKEALGVTGGGGEPTTFTCGTDKLVIGTNEYETVQIGTQCWTKTNLREPAGTQGTSSTDTSSTAPYYYDYSGHSLPLATRGYLYNWPAANQVCPAGWHLPSDAEWNTLEDTVSGSDWQDSYATASGFRGSHAGKLAGEGWKPSSTAGAPGNATDANHNASGFSAVPAGYYYYDGFVGAGSSAYFWSSSTENGTNRAWRRRLYYHFEDVHRDHSYRLAGFSVRCLRDE